jgi:GDPmannose 4,6-dehydratase
VATGEAHSIREFLDAAFGLLGLDWHDYVTSDPYYYRASEVDFLMGDSSKAQKALNWKPKIGFAQLVKLMVEHDLDLAEREAHAAKFDKKA